MAGIPLPMKRSFGETPPPDPFPRPPPGGERDCRVSSLFLRLVPLGVRFMAGIPLPMKRSFGEPPRRDRWWVTPALVFAGLSLFIVYATWAAFQGAHYHF